MKKIHVILLFITISVSTLSAQKLKKLPEYKLPSIETETHLRFLASDEMLGRKTGEQGNLVAARYIAEQFRYLGLKTPAGQNSYLQPVPFKKVKAATEGSIEVGSETLKIIEDFLVVDGKASHVHGAPVVFAGNGWIDEETDDYKGLDVKGKVVVVSLGTPKSTSPFAAMQASEKKGAFAAERGAVGVVEIFTAKVPWKNITSFYSGERMVMDTKKADDKAVTIPHVWINGAKAALFAKEKLQQITMHTSEKTETPVPSYNVAGILEGSDPVLKNEYVILSAHYDHIGVGKNTGKEDSIFNGARDNAFGVAAILFAAKSLSAVKPKRSILFLGFTAEEIGLLGSRYYANNPLVPLKNCVYNLNCDGAGYNDTTLLTTIGFSRTDCKTELEIAATAFGLKIKDDPAPEQNLFDRSDNVSFAAKGIPAPTFSAGFTAFDDAIFKYYHQATDNPETINFNYLHKYCQVYAYSARLIANRKDAPKWIAGDKYEKAYQELYKK